MYQYAIYVCISNIAKITGFVEKTLMPAKLKECFM